MLDVLTKMSHLFWEVDGVSSSTSCQMFLGFFTSLYNQYYQVCKKQAHWCQSLCKQFGQRGLVVRGCSTHTTRQMLYSYWGEVHAGIDRLGQYLPVFEKQRSLANPSYTDSELCLWFAQTIKARHFCIDYSPGPPFRRFMRYECRVTTTMSAVSVDGHQPAVAPDKISTLQWWMHVNMTSFQTWHFLSVKGTTSCCNKMASVILQRRITVRTYRARVIGEGRCCTAIQMSNFGIRN